MKLVAISNGQVLDNGIVDVEGDEDVGLLLAPGDRRVARLGGHLLVF